MTHIETVQEAVQWLRQRVTSGNLKTDSRRISSGDGFIAWPGMATDGRQFVRAAIGLGAKACLVEATGANAFDFGSPDVAAFHGLKAASGLIAAEYFRHPSRDVEVVAITGTNGKTSTAWWLAQACDWILKEEHAAEYSCGLVGTFGIGVPGDMKSTGLTTPDPFMLHAELERMRRAGVRACAMEASSIGIEEHRLAGVEVKVAVFTNLTQDHLDYHGDMQSYWLAKRKLFDTVGLRTAVINLDDPKGDELTKYCAGKGLHVITVSTKQPSAQLFVQRLVQRADGMTMTIVEDSREYELTCPFIGEYNASNLLSVLGALRGLGYAMLNACDALQHCTAVPGRLEIVGPTHRPLVVVDYAHTPDALEKALKALRGPTRVRGGKLWCVFGCGGNRDVTKRPLMAAAAQANADRVVVTNDNPRFEEPQAIAEHIVVGFDVAHPVAPILELDRAKAISMAVARANEQDVILIAGKGHEDYQEVLADRRRFSDQDEARRALLQRRIEETL